MGKSIRKNGICHFISNSIFHIEARDSYRDVAKSSSMLSIHGIDLPCSLFPNYTNYNQKAVLKLPFSIRFRLDIGSNNDLNLNSARTQIIYDDVWLKFERQFIETVCVKWKSKVDKGEWEKIKKIFLRESKNDVFSELLSSM